MTTRPDPFDGVQPRTPRGGPYANTAQLAEDIRSLALDIERVDVNESPDLSKSLRARFGMFVFANRGAILAVLERVDAVEAALASARRRRFREPAAKTDASGFDPESLEAGIAAMAAAEVHSG